MGHDEYDHLRESSDLAQNKRYWAYKHTADGEITNDFGDYEELHDAIDSVIDIGLSEDGYDTTVRVVDKTNQNTVWMAGPVEATE